jgi:hypothetical protein
MAGRPRALRPRCRECGVEQKATLTLPAGAYAWAHASRRHLYVASSSSASVWPGRDRAPRHGVAHRSRHRRSVPTGPRYSCRRAPSISARTFRQRTFCGVQQSERGARLRIKPDSRRAKRSCSRPDRRRHLCPQVRDPRQPTGDPGTAGMKVPPASRRTPVRSRFSTTRMAC